MAGFGGSVKLQGESEYKKALKDITTNLKQVTAELKLNATQYSSNNKSVEALTTKNEGLTKKLDLQKSKVEVLTEKYEDISKVYATNSQKVEDITKAYTEEKSKLEILGNTLGKTSTEYQDQAKLVNELEEELTKTTATTESNKIAVENSRAELTKAKTELEKTSQELEKNQTELKDSASAYGQLTSKISEQESQLEKLQTEYKNSVLETGKASDESKDLKAQIDSLNAELQTNKNKLAEVGDELETVSDSAENAEGGFTVFKGALANLVADTISNAISALKNLAQETIEVGTSFSSAMSQVSAVSGATGDDLEALTQKAKEMGEKTKFSATESAEAFNYMAMAGWKTKDMLNGIEGIMQLASASGADLATTSDIVTDALTGFGESADQAGRLADIMASASSNANTNVELMGETFKYVTPVAGSLGMSMEDTALAIGLMANSGIKGSQAGTALRSILTRLSTDAGASSKKLGALGVLTENLGVQFYNTDGTCRDLYDILNDTRQVWGDLTAEQQTSYGKMIAGQEALAGWLSIMNASQQDFDKLTNAINNSAGSAENMSNIMVDNLGGDLTLMRSHLESVQIAIYEKFEPALREGVKMLNKLIDAVSFVVNHSNEFIGAIKAMATALGVYVAYTTAIKVMTEGWTALTIVTKAQTIAQTALNAVMSANPIGLVIAGVSALVVAFMHFWNTSEEFRAFWINLWETIKNTVAVSIESIQRFFASAWTNITAEWELFKQFFNNLWANLVKGASATWQNITNTWKVASTWFNENIIIPLTEFFTNFWNSLIEGATVTWDGIVSVWSIVTSWFETNIIMPITTYFGNMWNNVISGAGSAWAGIKSVFSNITEWFRYKFTEAWTAVKNVFSTGGKIFDGIKEGIVDAFKAVVNAIIGGINKVIAIPFNAINATLNRIRNVEIMDIKPFANLISTFSVPQIPQLAKGGIVKGATLAEIGEDGAEAIVPLENNTEWIRKVGLELANTILTPIMAMQRATENISTQTADYDNLVDAFKEALEDMQIVLDDEKMGKWVDKTVTDAIYT